MVTASSYDPAAPPSGAVDAVIGGYLPEGGEDSSEWSSMGERAGAWINLQWANPVAVSSVVLYDRINLDVSCLPMRKWESSGSDYSDYRIKSPLALSPSVTALLFRLDSFPMMAPAFQYH